MRINEGGGTPVYNPPTEPQTNTYPVYIPGTVYIPPTYVSGGGQGTSPTYVYTGGTAPPSTNVSGNFRGVESSPDILPGPEGVVNNYYYYYPQTTSQQQQGGMGDWLSWLMPLLLMKMMMGGKSKEEDGEGGGLLG
jgi:hypothetical protein